MELLTPVDLGPIRLVNRIVSTSHQTGLVHDHLPTPDLVAYHEARARGGVGAIFLEATAVDPSGLLTSHTLGGFLPAMVGGYRGLCSAIHPFATKLFVQLFHGGREQISAPPRAPTVSASAVPSPRYKAEPRALTRLEIDELLLGYGTAARHCREGGVDGIEVSMSHGYLIAQFFAPSSNRRADAYAAPLKLAEQVLEAVRAGAGPGLAVGVRLSADELAPEGLDAAACAEVAAALCATGLVDFASFVLGHSAHLTSSTWIVPPPPAPADALAGPLAGVRAAAGVVPVIGTTQIVDVRAAERLIAGGHADAVGMTRALIADPELVAKVADGRADEVIACVGCNQGCIGHYHAGVPIGCLVNPRTGRERELGPPRAGGGASPRRVLVIGGGPAGVAAALEAAAHGDAVTLLERGAAVGGQLRLAGRAPAHQVLWRRWSAGAERRLERAGVDVRLDCAAEPGDADDYELVVLASGARPYVPPWAEPAEPDPFVRDYLHGPVLLDAWEAIANPSVVAGPVLVADWGGGWDGLDAAEVMAEQGLEVTLACAAPHPGETLQQYQRNLYLGRFDERGIALIHHTEVRGKRMRHVFSGRESRTPDVATIVFAQGRVPADELWPSLEGRAGVTRAGDVLGPRSAEEATLEGVTAYRAAAKNV